MASTTLVDVRLFMTSPFVQSIYNISSFNVNTYIQLPPAACGAPTAITENYNILLAVQSQSSGAIYGTN